MKTTQSHSPAPWKLASATQGGFECYIVDKNDTNVAKVYCAKDSELANARLVIAAPQMLSALKAMLALAGADSLSSLEMEAEDRAVIENALAIVTKAEGRM